MSEEKNVAKKIVAVRVPGLKFNLPVGYWSKNTLKNLLWPMLREQFDRFSFSLAFCNRHKMYFLKHQRNRKSVGGFSHNHSKKIMHTKYLVSFDKVSSSNVARHSLRLELSPLHFFSNIFFL